MASECQYCGEGFLTFRGLSCHRRYCSQRPQTADDGYPEGFSELEITPTQRTETSVPTPTHLFQNTEEEENEDLDFMINFYNSQPMEHKGGSEEEHPPDRIGGGNRDQSEAQQGEDDYIPDLQEGSPDAVDDGSTVPDEIKQCMFKGDSVDSNILKHLKDIDQCPRFSNGIWDQLNPEQKSDLLLLDILKGENLALFDKIKSWSRISKHELGFDPTPRHIGKTREKACDEMMKLFGFEHILPKTKTITLPNTGVEVDLIVFPFAQMLLSLLTDPQAMQPENLSIDTEDPCKKPQVGGTDGCYSEFNTGTVHEEAHKKYCKRENDLLCEITLFIDRTHLDSKGKHTVEPVLFTLGIFNQEFRNTDAAWRTIGYLPNLDLLAPHADAEDKSRDYHYCIRILMSELVALQRLGGLEWTLRFGGPDKPVFLQIPVNCVLGDTEGHDKIMGRHTDRSGRVPGTCLCRYCEVPFENLGNPLLKDNYDHTKCSVIRELRSNGSAASVERLKRLGYKAWHDGFLEVQFSDPERGLHGCTPAELLHAIQLGIFERSIESAFGAKRARKEAKRKNKKSGKRDSDGKPKSIAGSGEVMEALKQEDASSRNIFNKKAKERVDMLAKQLHRYLRWQSDGDLPRTSFPNGITNLSKMQGNERSGVLLILLIVLIMDHWALYRRTDKGAVKSNQPGYFEDAFGTSRNANVIKSLYLLLSFEAHMKLRRVPIKSLRYIKSFVPIFMDQVLRTFNREEGAKNNTIKNHLPLHYADDLERFGCAQNFNSGTGEMILKPIVKETGRRTNMHSTSFERQTGRRYVENLAIVRARMEYDATRVRTHQPLQLGHLKARISRTQIRNGVNRIINSLPIWKDSHLAGTDLLSIVREHILSKLPTTSEIPVYGRVVIEGQAYNANPSANDSGQAKQEWGYVNMGPDGVVPCQLLCALEISEKPSSDIVLNNSRIDDTGVYFLVHAAHSELTETGPSPYQEENAENQNEGTLAHVDQKLVHRIPKSHFDGRDWIPANAKLSPAILLVDSRSIVSPCIAVPDVLSDNSRNDFFFIRPVSEWAGLFEKEAKNFFESKS